MSLITSPLICQSLVTYQLICQSLVTSWLICQSLVTPRLIVLSFITPRLTFQNRFTPCLPPQDHVLVLLLYFNPPLLYQGNSHQTLEVSIQCGGSTAGVSLYCWYPQTSSLWPSWSCSYSPVCNDSRDGIALCHVCAMHPTPELLKVVAPCKEPSLIPYRTTVEPPEVAASAAEPLEVSVVSVYEFSPWLISANKAVNELLLCPELATEATYELFFCPGPAKSPISELSSCTASALEADCNLSDYELSICPGFIYESVFELSVVARGAWFSEVCSGRKTQETAVSKWVKCKMRNTCVWLQ